MAMIPAKSAPDNQAAETIEQRFRRLEAVWESETLFLSDAHKIIAYPAFQATACFRKLEIRSTKSATSSNREIRS